jgi:RnfABCDGE-type electron transport complex B subunit
MDVILIPIAILGGLGLLFAAGLTYASKKFAVEIDSRIEKIEEYLAGANCGACGFAGCRGYAEAIVANKIGVDSCSPAGVDAAKEIASVMGVEISEKAPEVAVVQCRGGNDQAQTKFVYEGIQDCNAAQMVGSGAKSCSYGCLGLGSCVAACPFGALSMGANGLPVVDEEKCTACGVCVSNCPRGVMALIPKTQEVYLGCVNHDRGAGVKKMCQVGCIACRLCVRKNPEGEDGISMGENLPIINYENLSNWSEANEVCPQNCFVSRKVTV